ILVAPAVLTTTLLLFGSGVALLVLGPAGGVVLGLHKVSFVLWLGATSVHVLAHLLKLPRLASADLSRLRRLPSSGLRLAILGGSLAVGAALAAGSLHLAQPWIDWSRASG